MKAVFIKTKTGTVLFFVIGLLMFGLFIFLNHMESDSSAFIAGIVFCGICWIFGLLTFFYNRGACLYIEDGRIKGKYGLFGRIDLALADVDYAFWKNQTLTVILKNDRRKTIFGLKSPWEVCEAIRREMDFRAERPVDELAEELKAAVIAWKRGSVITIVFIVLMFAVVLVTVPLTGGREFADFSGIDWMIAGTMGVLAIVCIAAAFYIANKTGKRMIAINRLKYTIRRTVMETAPPMPGRIERVFTDDEYLFRVTWFGFQDGGDTGSYAVQLIDPDYRLTHRYTKSVERSEDDENGLPEEFAELIDITDKVYH